VRSAAKPASLKKKWQSNKKENAVIKTEGKEEAYVRDDCDLVHFETAERKEQGGKKKRERDEETKKRRSRGESRSAMNAPIWASGRPPEHEHVTQ